MLMAGKSYPEIVEELRKEIDAYPDHLLAHVVYWRFQYFDTASPDTLIILMNRAAEHFARLRDLPIARDSVLSFEAISYGDVDRVIWLSLIQQAKGKKVQKLIREMKQNIIRTVEAIPEGKRSPRVRGLYAAARDTSSLQYDLQAQQAAWEREYRQMTAEFVGKPAPDFPFRTIDGDRRRLSDFRGKLVLLDFWGSWCGPCVAEIPNLKVAYGKYASRGVVFISISNDAQASRWDVDDLRAFARKNGMSWTQVLDDSEGSLQKLYGIRFYPNMFLIGRDGTVLTRQGVRGDELQATLEKALGE
jgi:peroxiredoxin